MSAKFNKIQYPSKS